MTIRLAALDLDGTLLDPFAKLTPKVRSAVETLSRRGVRVVVCTGRRFRTALPHARDLGLDGEIIVNNGVLVKDIASGRTLQHAFLDPDLYGGVLEHLRQHAPPLVYIDTYHDGTDILSERIDAMHAFQREYVDDTSEFLQIVDDLGKRDGEGVIMISTMADEPTLEQLREGALERFGARVQTHSIINKNYQGSILEFLSPDAGKWTALERLAASWGIGPSEIAAVGDDTNDAEMIREAGLGIAMGNAGEHVQAVADTVVNSNAEGGAIQAIERILARL